MAPAVTVRELEFPIDQFITIGSPLGLFLALRRWAHALNPEPEP